MTIIALEKPSIEEVLAHHGIKGMKWGVRKEDDASVQIRREEKAQKHVRKADNIQRQIDKLNARPSNRFTKRKINTQIKELDSQKKIELENADRKRQGKLTDHQKRVIKGAAIAATVLAAYGTYQAVQSGEVHRLSLKGKAALLGKETIAWKKNASLANPDLTPDALLHMVVKPVNPGYGDLGTKMNCKRATFAYEMRRRGFDVAATKTTNARGQHVGGMITALDPNRKKDYIGGGPFGLFYQMGKERTKSAFGSVNTPTTDAFKAKKLWGDNVIEGDGFNFHTKIFKALSSQPNHARGEVAVGYAMGGHSMAWEIVKGKPIIIDNQSGKLYRTAAAFHKDFEFNIRNAGFTRLDNVPLNDSFLMRWLKDAT